MSDIRMYFLWLFLWLASEERVFLYLGLLFVVADMAIEALSHGGTGHENE